MKKKQNKIRKNQKSDRVKVEREIIAPKRVSMIAHHHPGNMGAALALALGAAAIQMKTSK